MRNRYFCMLFAASLAFATAPAAVRAINIGDLHCNDATGTALTNGQVVTVQGVVTANQPTGANSRFYIQDATGGINIFGTPQNCSVALGDLVEVTGTVQMFNGLTEVGSTVSLPLTVSIISSGHAQPEPVVLTIPQVENSFHGDNCEPNESRVIKAYGLMRTSTGAVPATGATFAANTNYRLMSSGADSATVFTTVRVVQSTNNCSVANSLVGQVIPISCLVEVIGVLSQFDSSSPFTSGWQTLPASAGTVYCSSIPVNDRPWTQMKRMYR